MKVSVDNFAQTFNLEHFAGYGMWFYLLVGTVITALMHSSAATIAIALAALNSQLITFEMGAAIVIGANIGTTITVLLGAIGGSTDQEKGQPESLELQSISPGQARNIY